MDEWPTYHLDYTNKRTLLEPAPSDRGFGEPLGNRILLDQLGKSGKKIEYSASTRWGIVETALSAETNQPKGASLSFPFRDPTPVARRE